MAGIGIVTNPHSKANKSNPNNIKILGFILGHQGQLEVTNTLNDLMGVAKKFKEQSIEILAINGGDGTISRTISAFLSVYQDTPLPKIALLRGGTMNVIAQNLGIKGTSEELLTNLVETYASGQKMMSRHLNCLKIQECFGFLFATGVAADFLSEYYKKKSGPFGAFILVMKVWLSGFFNGDLYNKIVKNIDFLVSTKHSKPIKQSTLSFLCSTVRSMPLSYPLFTKLDKESRKFQCVSFTIDARSAFWKFPFILLKGNISSKSEKFEATLDQVTLTCTKPFNYTLDGELFMSNLELDINIGPTIEFLIF